jgi:hypothetical protein
MIRKFLPWILTLLYLLSPIDIIPDYIIGPGFLDDLLVLAVLVFWWTTRVKRTLHNDKKTSNYSGERRKSPDEKEDDPYKILGLNRDANKEEIKAAFKRLAAQYHPDKVQHLGEEFRILAHNKFVKIKNAYEKLMDK